MPYKKIQGICANCLHGFLGKPKQAFCSKKCAALSPEGRLLRSVNASKINLDPSKRAWRGGDGNSKQKYSNRKTNSPEYRAWRLAVLKRDNYTCIRCHKTGIMLHAHHILSWERYPKYRFDVANGSTLCRRCHTLEEWKSYLTISNNQEQAISPS